MLLTVKFSRLAESVPSTTGVDSVTGFTKRIRPVVGRSWIALFRRSVLFASSSVATANIHGKLTIWVYVIQQFEFKDFYVPPLTVVSQPCNASHIYHSRDTSYNSTPRSRRTYPRRSRVMRDEHVTMTLTRRHPGIEPGTPVVRDKRYTCVLDPVTD